MSTGAIRHIAIDRRPLPARQATRGNARFVGLVATLLLAALGGPAPAGAQLVGRYAAAGPVAGFYDSEEEAERAIVVERTYEGHVIHDVRLSNAGGWQPIDTVIGRFSGKVVGIGAFYSLGTWLNHVVVGLKNGAVYDLAYRDPRSVTRTRLAKYSSRIVAVSGFQTANGDHHAVVALRDGSIHDIARDYSADGPARDTIVASFPRFATGGGSFSTPPPPIGTEVLAIAGMGGRFRDERTIVVALRGGEIRSLRFEQLSQTPIETSLARFSSRPRALSVFRGGVLAALADHSLHLLEEGLGLVVDTTLYTPGNPLVIIGTSGYDAPAPTSSVRSEAPGLVRVELEPRFLISTLDGLVSRHFFDGFGPATP